MSFFDKLRGVVDTAKNSVTKAVESAQASANAAKLANDPLSDPTVKKYFEIICGMRNTFGVVGPEPLVGNVRAKNYVEHFLGGACNEETLGKVLELYNRSRSDYPSGSADQILSNYRKKLYNESLREPGPYQLNRYRAFRMFCQDEIDAAKVEYNRILDVIKDNVNYKHFSQGMKTLTCSNTAKAIAVADSFIAGNPITRELVWSYVIDGYIGRFNNSTYRSLYGRIHDIAVLCLRALHFDKYGKNAEGYATISDEDIRNSIMNITEYRKSVEDHPFEKEQYIEKYAKRIREQNEKVKTGDFLYGLHGEMGDDCFGISVVDDYFFDAVSHFLWKEIAGKRTWINDNDEKIGESKNINDMVGIIYAYLEDPDEQ